MADTIDAEMLAKEIGISAKEFRRALRAANFPWHIRSRGRSGPWRQDQVSGQLPI